MAQTVVSWLINYCERENWSLPSDIEEIAKEMEKEQIQKSFNYGYLDYQLNFFEDGEQYYNETYGK
jgi:hypothetical protein